MATYKHFQEAKKAETLPESEKVGVCLTCRYWDLEDTRPTALTGQIARCLYPQLQAVALLVSGSSACNKWAEYANAGPEAKAYAEQGE